MSVRSAIDRLLYPKSIAVIGASDQPDKFSGRVLKHLLKSGFNGAIFPINPNRKEVQGVTAYRNLSEVPSPVDLAVMMVPNQRLFEALEDCRLKRIGAALVLNSGFAEAGDEGKRLQEKLEAFAKTSGTRVCGPNCNGYVNVVENLVVGTSGAFDRQDLIPGDIAFLVQSGGVAGVLFDLAQERKIGVSYCVSVGNEADLDVADFIEYLAEDPHTRVIALFVEGVKDGRRFLSVLGQARARGKRIIVCKAGRSSKGQEAASAHTGKLAGSPRVWSAAMRRAGVVEVADLEELVEGSQLLSRFDPPLESNLAILTLSGGQGVLLADLCETHGINLPPPSSASAVTVRNALPEFAAMANPIDLTGQASGNPEVLEQVASALAHDPRFGAVLLVLVASPVAARLWTERIANLAASLPKPMVVLWSGGRGLDVWRDRLVAAGVAVFGQATVCIRSLAGYFAAGKPVAAEESSAGPDAARAQTAIESLKRKAADGIAEPDAKELAKLYGLPVPRELLARTEQEAVEAFRDLGGPVAMKVISPAILHRSDAGLVLLGVASAKDARESYRRLIERARASFPAAPLRGVLVQEMISGGVETLAGISYDPQFGPAVVFGSGGVTAELVNDVSLRLCPLSVEACHAMIAETKVGQLLQGYRGAPAGDIEALVSVLLALSDLAQAAGRIVKEMDINPLVVRERGRGVVAVDVRLVAASDLTEVRV